MTSPAAVRFLSDRVLTASPAQRVVMLYDRALLDLDRADAACATGLHHDASAAVMHAVAVVSELESSLDPGAWDGGTNLSDLYTWVLAELFRARDGVDLTPVSGVRAVLGGLRQAWAAVATTSAEQQEWGGRAS